MLNVLYHLGCCRSCECQYRHIGEQLAEICYLKVGRSEIVTPLRYAVGFIYCDEAHLGMANLV